MGPPSEDARGPPGVRRKLREGAGGVMRAKRKGPRHHATAPNQTTPNPLEVFLHDSKFERPTHRGVCAVSAARGEAAAYYRRGLAPIPTKPRTKEPDLLELAPYLERRATGEELEAWPWRG